MRAVIAVDLALRFSACVVLGLESEVVNQWDSSGMHERAMTERVVETALATLAEHVPLLVIEDLPPHVPASLVTKGVSRLQGRILQALPRYQIEHTYFVPPAYWQRAMGVFRKTPEEIAVAAAELGYQAPDLLAARGLEVGMPGKATKVTEARKQMTDYTDAFLIATWAQECMERDDHWDMTIVKRFEY